MAPSSTARFSDYYVALGGGRLALPAELPAGEEWHGEHVLRWHNYYWKRPVFDRHTPRPLPELKADNSGADDDFVATAGPGGGLQTEPDLA